MSAERPVVAPVSAERPVVVEPVIPSAPACAGEPAVARVDFNHVADGGRYFVDVVLQGQEWMPAEAVPMPFHHATRIEWVNGEAIAALGAAAALRLRFTFVIEGREIRQVPDQREWRVTVRARIVEICAG